MIRFTGENIKAFGKDVKTKVTKFWKDHKAGCVIAGLIIFEGVCYVILRRPHKDEKLSTDDLPSQFDDKGELLPAAKKELLKRVDEDIFTDLAPLIEKMVMDDSIEKAGIERTYDTDINYHKIVTVSIEQVVGD